MNDLIEKIKKARMIWVCGNGGSAATAEHFVTDLIKKGYPAVCLNSNASVLTMIANDYGYEYIFSKQLITLWDRNDLLVTISCSGTSPNILKAQLARTYYEFETFDQNPSEGHTLLDYQLLENKHLKFAHEVANAL